MIRRVLAFACFAAGSLFAATEFSYDVARFHELKPHRGTFPLNGVSEGFDQFHLTLVVSPTGDVIDAKASGNANAMPFWPQLRAEVMGWKFRPFEVDGKAVTAEVEEYIDLVPPERLPTAHVPAPSVTPMSKISIELTRSGCYGTCPAYRLTITTDGIVFEGDMFVVAAGKHIATVDPQGVRELAKRFADADFYSLEDSYRAAVTDMPAYALCVSIDGRTKKVQDYVGHWVGMPAVVRELEGEVDELARTDRWINGSAGLVQGLEAEGFHFESWEGQVILKEAAGRGQANTVRELLQAGVPLAHLPAPKAKQLYMGIPFEQMGWLTAASASPDVLRVLIDVDASKNDQRDKNGALAGAAGSGRIDTVRELIAYGANPDAQLPSGGSVLINAAHSGKPEVVSEILRYRPRLELRDGEGQTAIFAAGYFETDEDDGRVECIRLLAHAGANINARDNDGNTPLHEIFLTDVEEELLKLGANVNARNNDGETPIFTNVDNDSIALFIRYGADLNIRDRKGRTVMQAAKDSGPAREKALREALATLKITLSRN